MKKHVGALSTIALLAGSLPNLFAQGSSCERSRTKRRSSAQTSRV